MSVLSAQSIRRLCVEGRYARHFEAAKQSSNAPLYRAMTQSPEPLITPFSERRVVNGKSYGLSACSYDCRIDQDLVLEPMPFEIIAKLLYPAEARTAGQILDEVRAMLVGAAKFRALASTIERFNIPHNVCGSVLDKSSYARVFVSAFNTHFDPGFRGVATIELANLGPETVVYKRGDPLCQFKFEWLDEPTESPYEGKYQDQGAGPQGPRHEETA